MVEPKCLCPTVTFPPVQGLPVPANAAPASTLTPAASGDANLPLPSWIEPSIFAPPPVFPLLVPSCPCSCCPCLLSLLPSSASGQCATSGPMQTWFLCPTTTFTPVNNLSCTCHHRLCLATLLPPAASGQCATAGLVRTCSHAVMQSAQSCKVLHNLIATKTMQHLSSHFTTHLPGECPKVDLAVWR